MKGGIAASLIAGCLVLAACSESSSSPSTARDAATVPEGSAGSRTIDAAHAGRSGTGASDTGAPAPSKDAATPDAADAAASDTGVRHTPDASNDAPVADAAPPPALTWTPCQTDFECATLDAPRGDPGGPTLAISVIRRKAFSTEPRLGVLMYNPGGPGAAAVANFSNTYSLLESLIGADVMHRFDAVTFDWRGLGQSTPLIVCGDDSTTEGLENVDVTASTPIPPGFDTAVSNFTAACVTGTGAALLARVDTESAARDMDLLREALGEQKINFIGASYGTWLGATYATLFPSRLRAFVLDSCVAPHPDRRDLTRDLARGVEEALPQWFAWCDTAGSPCTLAADVGTATTAEAFDAIIQKLETTPLAVGSRKLTALLAMRATRNLLMGTSAAWLELWSSLSLAWKGDGAHLLGQADSTFDRDPAGHYHGGYVAARAILAMDLQFPAGFTTNDYVAFRGELATSYPRAGAFAGFEDLLTLRWPVQPPSPKTPIGAPTAPPLLLIGGKHDPATIFDQTLRLQAALGNGSYVVAAEGQGHFQMTQNPCTGAAAAAYLVDPTTPPATTSCPSTFP